MLCPYIPILFLSSNFAHTLSEAGLSQKARNHHQPYHRQRGGELQHDAAHRACQRAESRLEGNAPRSWAAATVFVLIWLLVVGGPAM